VREWRVVYDTQARDDIDDIYNYIASAASEAVAQGYVDRIRTSLSKLSFVPYQGRPADQYLPGLRITGFEGRVTIGFFVGEQEVRIFRVLYGGRDLAKAFRR